jgi:LacI family transcriptional regulator
MNDNVLGAFLATSHLLEHGYRRVAYLASSPAISSCRERLEGYRKALRAARVKYAPALVMETPLSVDGGERSCERLLSLRPKPDAFFTYDDVVAAGVARALKKRRLRVGRDVGLVGYDDVELASLLEVPLTTVHQSSYDIGRVGAETLLAKIGAKRPRPAQRVVLKPWLAVRESCGCGTRDASS